MELTVLQNGFKLTRSTFSNPQLDSELLKMIREGNLLIQRATSDNQGYKEITFRIFKKEKTKKK